MEARVLLGAQQDFNSRPREGANGAIADLWTAYLISIPAPVRGRTPWQPTTTALAPYFNSRPREGANGRARRNYEPAQRISIPAPVRGRTQFQMM